MGYYPPDKVARSMTIRPAPYPAPPLPPGAREAFLEFARKDRNRRIERELGSQATQNLHDMNGGDDGIEPTA